MKQIHHKPRVTRSTRPAVCGFKAFYTSTLQQHARQRRLNNNVAARAAQSDGTVGDDPQNLRVRAVAALDTGEQIEQIELWLEPGSELIRVDLDFPMGLVFEAETSTDDSSGSSTTTTAKTVVAEVTPGGAADAAGVRPADVLRAASAAMMRMTYPTAQLMLGGVGRPKRMRALVPVTGFAAAMDAIRSNTLLRDGEGVTLFLERGGGRGADAGGGTGKSSSSGKDAAVVATEEEQKTAAAELTLVCLKSKTK
jgi:hypothetical protein